MKKQKLILEQIDRKIIQLRKVEELSNPSSGWVKAIRQSLGMSLRQLGLRMGGITAQSVKEIEERESNDTLSIKVLKQFGNSLNMKFVYGFIPKNKNLEEIIEIRAKELAKEINGCVWMGGRMVDDFRPLHSVPDLKETIVPPSIKSEMDPHNIESDERFLDIVSKIKDKVQSEMPIMAAEVLEQVGEGLDDVMKEKIKQVVYATATTTSMLTIRFLMETINEVVGE